MKKINLLLSFILLFVFVRCSDNLELKPSDRLPFDSSITSLKMMNTSLNGVYSTLVNRWAIAGDIALHADGKGGDVDLIDRSCNHFQPIVTFITDRNSGVSEKTYKQFGFFLTRINHVLTLIEGVEDKNDDLDHYNNMIGQLYALRALGHFELARLYAQIPVIAKDVNAENSGIALNDRYYEYTEKFKRATLKETYDLIVSDLNQSLPLLSKKKTEGSGYINYWSVKALLSRVYLYMGDYNHALSNAIEVIHDSPYTLYPLDEYKSVWKKKGTSESLFEVLTTDKNNAQTHAVGYFTNPKGYAECAAAKTFQEWLGTINGDVRAECVVLKKGVKGKNDGYYTTKYEGQEGASTPLYVNNVKVIRLSEMYLIAAESVLKGGVADGAKEAVWYYNTLRKNRVKDYQEVTEVTLDNVLDELRLEFFCENHRMYDLVRNKREILTPNVAGGVVKYDDYRILIAIPQREMNISPELVQNPGW